MLKISLTGVEYIITYRIFETLTPDEQKLWHSHAYEVHCNTTYFYPSLMNRNYSYRVNN